MLLTYDGGAALGLALIGFFGAGVVVLGRKASLTGGRWGQTGVSLWFCTPVSAGSLPS